MLEQIEDEEIKQEDLEPQTDKIDYFTDANDRDFNLIEQAENQPDILTTERNAEEDDQIVAKVVYEV